MATGMHLQPPESFNFQTPDEWPHWRKRFEQYRIASGLGAKSQEQQVNTLFYCLGEESDDVLTSTDVTVDERKSYSEVFAKFDRFFTVHKNVIFERAVFNRRQQAEGETAEQYIAALYNLASNCNYGELQNELIRDRLIVGIRNSLLSEQLQMDAELTLEKAKKLIQQKGAVHGQQSILHRSESTAGPIDAVKSGNSRDKNQIATRQYRPPRRSRQPPQSAKHCTRYGKSPHSGDKCPARESLC